MEEGNALLADALVDTFAPPLDHIAQQLDELEKNQRVLLEAFGKESQELQQLEDWKRLERVFEQLPAYKSKCKKLRGEMNSLSERAVRLKRRAGKLTEARKRAEMKEASLAAKPSPELAAALKGKK